MRIKAAIRPMRISAAIRPRDDTRLAVYSETMITLIRPHSEQRTATVRRSGPMSVTFRPSDRQCGQATGDAMEVRRTEFTAGEEVSSTDVWIVIR